MWYLIVSIPDLCTLTFIESAWKINTWPVYTVKTQFKIFSVNMQTDLIGLMVRLIWLFSGIIWHLDVFFYALVPSFLFVMAFQVRSITTYSLSCNSVVSLN